MQRPIHTILLTGFLSLWLTGPSLAQSPTTTPAEETPATRPAGPIQAAVSGIPAHLRVGQLCTATIEFKNVFTAPIEMQTLQKAPNLHLKIWYNGDRLKSPALPVADGSIVLKPGQSAKAELDLAALGLTQKAGRYLIVADVISYLASEELRDRPPLKIPVTARFNVVVEGAQSTAAPR